MKPTHGIRLEEDLGESPSQTRTDCGNLNENIAQKMERGFIRYHQIYPKDDDKDYS